MWPLLFANIKMMFRDKQALFWAFLFPILFLFVFGLFMGGDEEFSFSIAVFDEANTEISTQIVETLNSIEAFEFTDEYDSIVDAREGINDGDLGYVVEIPKSLVDLEGDAPHTIVVHVNEQQSQYNQVIQGIIQDVLTGFNLEVVQAPKLFIVEQKGLITNEISFFDFVFMGILGMGIMMYAINGLTTTVVNYRERKILKRLMVTPIKKWHFITAEMFSYLLLGIFQTIVILLAGIYIFGGHVYGNIGLIFLLVLLGDAIFLAIALILSSLVDSSRAAEGVAIGIALPMMFFSGTFFPTDMLPTIVQSIVKYFPLTPMLEALRSVALQENGIDAIGPELLIMGIWLIVATLVAIFIFKFEKQK